MKKKAEARKLSEETKDKIRKALKGKIVSLETRKKQSLAMLGKNKGKKRSLETKILMSKIHKGKNLNNKFGLGNKSHTGLKDSAKTKRKKSLALGGTGISGELSEYGPEFDSALKEQVRFRDGYKCQECGCTQIENDRGLDIHHIDYNKKNNKSNNLISLCRSCHMKTNIKRAYWTKQYQKVLGG